MKKPRYNAMEKARAELLQTKGYYWKCWRKPINQHRQNDVKPVGCWKCPHLIAYNPEEDKCALDGHIFEDRFILSATRDKDCPLDISKLKGENE